MSRRGCANIGTSLRTQELSRDRLCEAFLRFGSVPVLDVLPRRSVSSTEFVFIICSLTLGMSPLAGKDFRCIGALTCSIGSSIITGGGEKVLGLGEKVRGDGEKVLGAGEELGWELLGENGRFGVSGLVKYGFLTSGVIVGFGENARFAKNSGTTSLSSNSSSSSSSSSNCLSASGFIYIGILGFIGLAVRSLIISP